MAAADIGGVGEVIGRRRPSLAAGPVQFVDVYGIVISIREAALVIRQRDEAVLQVLIFSAFVSVSRTLDEFAVPGCFHAIPLGFEHAERFRLKSRLI